MKIRCGFVSNRSSSSFMVTTDNHEIDDITLSIEIPIKDLVRYEIKTLFDLDDYFEEEYGDDFRDMFMDESGNYYEDEISRYNEMKDILKSKQTILICSCSNEDENIGSAIYEYVGLNEIVVKNGVIYEEEF